MFNDVELSLIKSVFSDNEELLYAIRKVLLQFEMTKEEKKMIKTAMTPEVFAVLKKRILPTLDPDSPLSQLASLSTTLTDNLKVKDVEEMAPLFEAKQLETEYLEQRFAVLKNIDAKTGKELKLADFAVIKGKTPHRQFVDTTVYLFLLGYIDPMLAMIRNIAGQKEESIEAQKERMTRNSAK